MHLLQRMLVTLMYLLSLESLDFYHKFFVERLVIFRASYLHFLHQKTN